MDDDELKKLRTLSNSVKELSSSYAETLENFRGFSECLKSTKSLWKEYDKSKLVKIGLTLIALPEPTPLSEMIGASILSVGLIQQRMRNNSLHINDVYKTFRDVFKNLKEIQHTLTKY
ncbi:hypothetical protein DRO54_03605 [Candidatus Bathyarchaeota archaeon]|nr:MAG: hypothetical protein DRO54_03605 [Candidatus Bathyarchaeota archaeon]